MIDFKMSSKKNWRLSWLRACLSSKIL